MVAGTMDKVVNRDRLKMAKWVIFYGLFLARVNVHIETIPIGEIISMEIYSNIAFGYRPFTVSI